MLAAGKLDRPGTEALLHTAIDTGQHRNPHNDDALFTTAYFHDPHGLRTEADTVGLRTRTLLAVEGPAKLLPDLAARMTDPVQARQVMQILRHLEAQPSALGTSQHILLIADKPRGPRHDGQASA
jgi:hypothetical protein